MTWNAWLRHARLGLVFGIAGLGAAAAAAAPGVLRLRTGDVETAPAASLLAGDVDAFDPAQMYVIQLDGPLTPEREAVLAQAGVRLGEYLPENAFVADLGAAQRAELAALDFVAWVGAYRPAWRLDPAIGTHPFQTLERQALAASGAYALNVYGFDGGAVEPLIADLRRVPGLRLHVVDYLGTQPVVQVTLPAAQLDRLADLARVQFVEEYPELTARNSTDRWIVQSNISGLTPLYDRGLHGEDQVLGHMDQRLGVAHCSFSDTNPIGQTHRKILAYNQTQGYQLHGSHTAATAVGDAGAWNDTRGVAYLAKLVHNSWPSFTEAAMYGRLDLHRQQGATVHTNSWGNDATTAYDGLCRAIDNFSWTYDDHLVCFAVTNMSSLKNPENAKNCLAVGASQDTPNQGAHCSGGVGPTADGRRKPEIYAPGCGTVSASGSSGCSTSALTGTSMACPAVAGAGLLVRQYFTAGYYPSGTAEPSRAFTPSGALIKGVLLNSAVDMTGISGYPSNLEGWGRVLLDGALYFPNDAGRLQVTDVRNNTALALTTGQTASYPVHVAGGGPVRVTLVWHDAPAAVNAGSAPVNNLDLTVTGPGGVVHRGNVFSGGTSVPNGTADTINNVEQVHLASPAAGPWTVEVSGAAVNIGRQGYALVITGAIRIGLKGDLNCDGKVDFFDINAFVLALSDPAGYAAAFPACDRLNGDINGDAEVDFLDINPFVALLAGR